MMGHYLNMNFYFPKLARRCIAVSLYADNAAILSKVPIGPKRALEQNCKEDQLEFSYQKPKLWHLLKSPRITLGG